MESNHHVRIRGPSNRSTDRHLHTSGRPAQPRHLAESNPCGLDYWIGGVRTYTRNFLAVLPSASTFGVGLFSGVSIFAS